MPDFPDPRTLVERILANGRAVRAKRVQWVNPAAKRQRNAKIVRLRRDGASIGQLARRFNVSNARIRAILRRKA